MDVSKFKDGIMHLRNSRVKGLIHYCTYIGILELEDVTTLHMDFSGTDTQVLGLATSTILAAFIKPKPKAEFTQNPAPFCIQPL